MAAPSSALPGFILSTLLFSILFVCHCTRPGGREDHVRTTHHAVDIQMLLPGDACSPSKVPAAGKNRTIKVVHRRGHCSPYGAQPDPTLTLREELLRVKSIQRSLSKGAPSNGTTQMQAYQVNIPTRWGLLLGTGDYLVTVGFGSPKMDQTLILDTGSNLCWIQCRPCSHSCYEQQDPIFEPSASSTFRMVPCSSVACSNLDDNAKDGCDGDVCRYHIRYGDQSSTSGILAADTLTLTPDIVFLNFVFGCGQENQGLFGRAAGLIGLGRDPYSLVSQTSLALSGTFSYCLPSVSSSTGYLNIGGSTASASYTPILTDLRHPSLYSIILMGITVGNWPLPIPVTVFQASGTIIDSGTVVTRLPPTAYVVLRAAFRSQMAQYPMAPPLSIMDTCYDFSKVEAVVVPTVVLHFAGGADLPLQFTGIFFVESRSQMCLAFAGNGSPEDVGIIGNVQQRTTEVIYDLEEMRIGFAVGACT